VTVTTGLIVSAVGALTPVGLCAPASFAALRAGVSGLKEIETHKVEGETLAKVPAVGGRVPTEWFSGGPREWEWPAHDRFEVDAPPEPERFVQSGPQRLIEIAVPAALEAWRQASAVARPVGAVGLFLGLDYADDISSLAHAIAAELGVHVQTIGGATAGRAAGLVALEGAARALLAGEVQVALVGGVDSQIRAESMQRMESRGGLRSADNPQGVLAGEAAAFVVLERAESATRRGVRPQAWLMTCASSKEPTAGTDDPNQAAGLSEVLRVARHEGGIESPPLVICDLNGDRYRALEWGMALIRSLGDLHGDVQMWHPADCIGDCGAASGILNVGWAVTAMQKRYARAERVLVWGASDGRSRAATVLAPYYS
jgi:3-oxoacyl-[acyl-carrier-protein] synthase-1